MRREVINLILQTIITVLPVLFLVHLVEKVDIYRKLRNENQNERDDVDSQNDVCFESICTNKDMSTEKLLSALGQYLILCTFCVIVLGYRIWNLLCRYEEYHKCASYEYEIFLIAVSALILSYLYFIPIAEHAKRNTTEAKIPLNIRIERLLDHFILGKLPQVIKHIFEGIGPFLLLSQYVLYTVELLENFNIRPSFWPLLGIFAFYYYIGPHVLTWFLQKPLSAVLQFCITTLGIIVNAFLYSMHKLPGIQKTFEALFRMLSMEIRRTTYIKKIPVKLSNYFSELMTGSNLYETLKRGTYLSLLVISAFELSNGEGTISGVLGLLFLFDTYLKKEI